MLKKRISCLLITAMLTTTLVGCSTGKKTEDEGVKLKAGTYEKTVKGHNGDIKVQVIVEEDKIAEVKVIEHKETDGISDGAINGIPEAIVNGQTLAVETVTGATVSSKAILEAVEEALKDAGADVEALKNKKADTTELKKGETEETNIVIVGAGAAGIMGAMELYNNHENVNFIVLEKLPVVGGSLSMTGGAVLGTDSKQHMDQGFVVTAEDIAEYLDVTSDEEVDAELAENIFALSGDTLNVLTEMGAPFQAELDKASPYNDKIYTAWTEGKGQALYQFLQEQVSSMDIDLRLNSEVVELVVEDEAVKGVVVRDKEKEYIIKADKVIMATGGHGSNPEKMKELDPEYADGVIQTNGGATGDAYELLKDLDIPLVGEGTMGTIVASDKSALANSTFLVDMNGKRFTKETNAKYVLQHDLVRKANGEAVVIVDGTYEDKDFLNQGIEKGIIKEFATLEELADGMGINKENLLAEVDKYNSAVANNGTLDFELPLDKAQSLVEAPFYAQVAVPRTFGTITGIQVNENAQITDADGKIIENVYAAGELMAGNVFSSKYPGAGFGISHALNSGRLAVINAVNELSK